jgi:hypothetical protein
MFSVRRWNRVATLMLQDGQGAVEILREPCAQRVARLSTTRRGYGRQAAIAAIIVIDSEIALRVTDGVVGPIAAR